MEIVEIGVNHGNVGAPAESDAAGNPNPLHRIDKAYGWGRSQTGRCLRDFVHLGFIRQDSHVLGESARAAIRHEVQLLNYASGYFKGAVPRPYGQGWMHSRPRP